MTFKDLKKKVQSSEGYPYKVPFVSSQSWRRWLRDTLIEETSWRPSRIRVLHNNPKGNTDKIGGEFNPIEFPEDEIFGYMPIPHGSNSEPVMVPGKGNVIIAFNARSFTPTVIDSQGNVKGFAPNAAYAMTGSEKYINSGWLLPKGQEQGFPGSSNTFTVTFQKAGTYNYICEVHPWMLGSVIVK